MAELRTHHILSIAHLLSIGAGSDFVHTSTASLGDAIGRSQQSASAYLTELESIGYTKRSVRGGKTYVMVTKKGVLKIKQVSAALSKVLDSKNATGMLLSGKISSGVREGAYYMSLKKYVIQFKEKIGYVPYPGTLNISLDERSVQTAGHCFFGNLILFYFQDMVTIFPPRTLRLVYPMDSSSVRYADADCCERPIASPSEAVLVCTKSEPAPMDKRCAIDNM